MIDGSRRSWAPSSFQDPAFDILCGVLGYDENKRLASINAMLESGTVSRIIESAGRERLLPALFEALQGEHWRRLPTMDCVVLAIRHELNRRDNEAKRLALVEVGAQTHAKGFDCVPLKGATWLIENHERAGWRSMLDLDILVEPGKCELVPPMLEALGYQLDERRGRFGRRKFAAHFHLPPYRHPKTGVLIEVHRHVGYRPRLLPNEIAFSGEATAYFGVRLAPPWFSLLHAMLHWQAQNYGYVRGDIELREVLEVARRLRRDDVDWGRLAAHIRQAGVVKECAAAISLSSALLGAAPPKPIAASLGADGSVWKRRARANSPLGAIFAAEAAWIAKKWDADRLTYRLALARYPPAGQFVLLGLYRLAILPLALVACARAIVAIWRVKTS